MKKTVIRSAIVLAMVVGIFAAAAFAQDEPMTGGYGKISVRSKEAKTAAALAVRQHSAKGHDKVTLVKILKAEQQVVAGMNYRVCMIVRGKHDTRRTVTAVVYQPLRKRERLTNWEAGECKDL